MSRRPNPQADRAAKNTETIKALLKLEGNKVCADCKRNKHPRWASWNLGIFVCIRCSGIHRGMGTHISRVKSVDLDAWTDEQLQSVLRWGNSRANKYWEAKLAAGHVPSEAKMENFIRTKYESKRWVMDGPMPDPATLDTEGDEDVPLNIVQEKAKLDRSTSQRAASNQQAPQQAIRRAPAQNIDLFGEEPLAPPVRPSTADIPDTRPVKSPPTQQRQAKQGESLLGLDFFGGPPSSSSGRPSSAASNPTSSRPDLKQSILSLYASAPKPQSQPSHDRQSSFGGMGSPPAPQQDPFGGLTDAFSSLSTTTSAKSPPTQQAQSAFSGFSTTIASAKPPSQQVQPPFSSFTGFSNSMNPKSTLSAPQTASPPLLSGGSFFDNVQSKPPPQSQPPMAAASSSLNGLDFSFAQSAAFSKPNVAATSAPKDLFSNDDFAGFNSPSPAPPPVPPPTKASSPAPSSMPTTSMNSPFNLSSPIAPTPQLAAMSSKPSATQQAGSAMFDPWASVNESNAWGAPDPTPNRAAAPAPPPPSTVELGTVPSRITPNDISGGWGAPISSAAKASQQATITADEDFGGWTSASPTQPSAATAPKSSGFGSTSDPFDNPW